MGNVPGYTTLTSVERAWVVDRHVAAIPITIAGSDTTAGALPSGQALGKITASGKYGKYDNAAVDGREDGTGLLMDASDATTARGDQLAAMAVHAVVKESETTDVDAPFKVDVGAAFIWT